MPPLSVVRAALHEAVDVFVDRLAASETKEAPVKRTKLPRVFAKPDVDPVTAARAEQALRKHGYRG